jgi:hypothetical protein
VPRSKRCKASGCATSYVVEEGHPPFRNWCSSDCAIQIARDRQDKARIKAAAKAKKKEKDTTKANRKAVLDLNKRTLSWQLKTTQPVFNTLRRLEEFKWFQDRGIEPYCISCQKTHMDWACGHYIPVSAGSSVLRFDPKNTYLQCNRYCNKALSSNRSGYEDGLVHRFGEQGGRAIMDYCKARTGPIKLTCEDLDDLRGVFNARIKVLQKGSI